MGCICICTTSPDGPEKVSLISGETEQSEIESDMPWKVLLLACALLLFCSVLIIMFMGTLATASTDEDATGTGDGDDSSALTHVIYRTPSRPVTRGTPSGSGASSRTIRTASPLTNPAAIPPPGAPLPPADEDATGTGDGNNAMTPVIYRTPSHPVTRGTRGGSGTRARTIRTASPLKAGDSGDEVSGEMSNS
nr:uncharacterized protein LOC129386776 [Dermacentor andersoni]